MISLAQCLFEEPERKVYYNRDPGWFCRCCWLGLQFENNCFKCHHAHQFTMRVIGHCPPKNPQWLFLVRPSCHFSGPRSEIKKTVLEIPERFWSMGRSEERSRKRMNWQPPRTQRVWRYWCYIDWIVPLFQSPETVSVPFLFWILWRCYLKW